MANALYNLIYISTASIPFDQERLTELLQQSRKFNSEHEITGLLLYAEGKFMQLLEGSKTEVEDLMSRIRKDPRHHDIEIPEQGYITHRQFSNWSMAFLDFTSPHVRDLPGYSNFLELPSTTSDLVAYHPRSLLLLHYFKLVMRVSNDALLKLAQTIRPPGQ